MDAVHSCGASMEQSLIIVGVLPKSLVDFLQQFEDYKRLREAVYHFFSNNRDVISNVIDRDPPVSKHSPKRAFIRTRRPKNGNPRIAGADSYGRTEINAYFDCRASRK